MTHWKKTTATAVISLVAWSGLGIQLWLSLRIAAANGTGITGGLVAYTGYFTILTNLFVALAMSLPLASPRSKVGLWFATPAVCGSAVTSIVIVGVIYHLLLRHVWNPQGWQLVADVILHYAVPAAMLLYWVLFPPERASWRWPFLWCLYPLAYFAYALLRGAKLHSYPYHFIDVKALGYATVFKNAGGMTVAFLVAGMLVTVLAAMRAGKRR